MMCTDVAIIGGNSFTARWFKAELNYRGMTSYSSQRQIKDRDDYLDFNDCNSYRSFFTRHQINTVVIFAGASASTGQNFSPYFYKNIFGPVNLVTHIVQNVPSVQQIVYASSSHVYGRLDSNGIDEKSIVQPASNYGYSKLVAEKYLSEVAGNKLTIVRPFNYTGIGQSIDFLIPKLVKAYKSKSVNITIGNMWPKRDFMDVRDVAIVYADIVQKLIRGKIINCCSGTSTSINDITDILERITGHKPNFIISDALVRQEPMSQIGSTQFIQKLGLYSKKYQLVDTLSWMLSE